MVSETSVAQLIEMGFTESQSRDALEYSNGNVEQALSYLFNEPLAVETNDTALEPLSGPARDPLAAHATGNTNPFIENIRTQVDQTDSSVSDFQTSLRNDNAGLNDDENEAPIIGEGLNRQEMTPVLPNRPGLMHADSKNIENYLDDDLRDTLSSYVSRDSPDESDSYTGLSDYDVFLDVSKHLRPEFLPPILVPGMRNVFELYFAPILMVLHEVTSVRNAILTHDLQEYPFSNNWYRGEKFRNTATPSQFVLETQILMLFLDGDSERFFTSIKNLINSLPKGLIEELVRVETVDELLNSFYATIVGELSLVEVEGQAEVTPETQAMPEAPAQASSPSQTSAPAPAPAPASASHLFHCKFNVPDQSEETTACFSIEFSHIRSNIYQSLHNIIIGENMERANSIDIFQFSDVITIPILAPEDVYNVGGSPAPQGMAVPELFYPQIFAKHHHHVYDEIRSELAELLNKRQHVTKAKQALTSFRGQRVDDALKASLDALAAEIKELSLGKSGEDVELKIARLSAALDDLEQFRRSFRQKNELLRNEWLDLNLKIDSFDLTTEIADKMHGNLELYMLVAAVFDESNFFYLTKNRDPASNGENQWIRVQYLDKNFHLGLSSFGEVEQNIIGVTSNLNGFSLAIVLLYCRVSCWNQTLANVPVPQGLQDFMRLDRENVYEMQKYLEPELGPRVADSSGEESDDSEESEGSEDSEGSGADAQEVEPMEEIEERSA